MMRTGDGTRRGLLLLGIAVSCAFFSGCVGPGAVRVGVSGQSLISLTQERLLACAGTPYREIVRQTSTLLVYYREAAMLEESFADGKASKPGYHHGCWARIMVENGRVTGVEFRPVPDPDADTHECQEIFATCVS